MSPEQWDQVRDLFHQALDLSQTQRREFLDSTDLDPAVRVEVQSLLSHQEKNGAFLDEPAIDGVRESIENALSDHPAADLKAGDSLGPYRIVCLIGTGGSGKVYKADDSRTGRAVAVKVVADEFGRSWREARAVAALNHPCVCTLYDLGPNYLVMEYVEGKALRGPVPLAEALRLTVQLADVLDAVHRKGIVHRDLKPANILVTKSSLKVLDFGLAKIRMEGAPADVSATRDGQIAGTLYYMAPEQLQGKPGDARSDIFAFGCVLYELLSGNRAFDGGNPADVIAAILDRQPPALPALPAGVERVLRRCLAKDADDRWQSARDLRIELEWLAAEGAPGAPGPLTAPPVRLRKIGMALAAVVLIAVAAVANLWMSTPPERPVRKFRITHAQLNIAGTHGSPVISPDGRKAAYTAGNQIFLQELDRLTPVEFYRTTDPGETRPAAPFWSPDSQSIAFIAGGNLWRVPLGGGRVKICHLPGGINGAAWGANDRIVVAIWRGDLWEVSALGGEPHPLGLLDPSHEIDFHNPAFLPDGRDLLYTVHPATGTSRIEVLTGGKRKRIFERKDWSIDSPAYSPSGHLLFSNRTDDISIWAVPFSQKKLEVSGAPFLVASGGTYSTVSNDGTLMYVAAPTSLGRLVLVGRSGAVEAALSQPQPLMDSPAWSWDGTRIAFVAGASSRRDLWSYDLKRGTQTKLATLSWGTNHPSWLAGDRQVVFGGWTDPPTVTNASLYIDAPDSAAGMTKLRVGSQPQVSGGGKYLTFTAQRQNGVFELWYMTLPDGQIPPEPSKAVLFIAGSSSEMSLRISPDGHYAAYVSNESGRNEIYIRRFPEGEGKWQVSANGGVQPVWSRQGDELFFIERPNRMMAVPVTTRGVLALGTPRNLFDLGDKAGTTRGDGPSSPTFDVSPDGKRFVMVQRAEGEPPAMIVVENWFAEFKPKR